MPLPEKRFGWFALKQFFLDEFRILPPNLPPIARPLQHVSAAIADIVIATVPIVVVDCSATWCDPCHKLHVRLRTEILPLIQDRLDIAILSVDLDTDRDFFDRYQVTQFPTMLLFRNGRRAYFPTTPPSERLIGHWGAPVLLDLFQSSDPPIFL